MNEYSIDLHDSKGHESCVIDCQFGETEDMIKTLLQAIETAKHYGYCRLTLEVTLES